MLQSAKVYIFQIILSYFLFLSRNSIVIVHYTHIKKMRWNVTQLSVFWIICSCSTRNSLLFIHFGCTQQIFSSISLWIIYLIAFITEGLRITNNEFRMSHNNRIRILICSWLTKVNPWCLFGKVKHFAIRKSIMSYVHECVP